MFTDKNFFGIHDYWMVSSSVSGIGFKAVVYLGVRFGVCTIFSMLSKTPNLRSTHPGLLLSSSLVSSGFTILTHLQVLILVRIDSLCHFP
jgi:hypothetical protein